MKLTEELSNLAEAAPDKHKPLLLAAVERLQAQRAWRDAWLEQVRENEKLVSELTQLRQVVRLHNHRKEKERND